LTKFSLNKNKFGLAKWRKAFDFQGFTATLSTVDGLKTAMQQKGLVLVYFFIL